MFLEFGKAGVIGTTTNIPNGRGPRTTKFSNLTYTLQEFEQAGYTQKSRQQDYPVKEITYQFNSCGYRCQEFANRSRINVISIGCSETFGVGVRQEERFSNIFCKGIEEATGETVSDFNIGIGAKSNDWIARTLDDSLPSLKPDVVLVCFTYINRREYTDITGFTYDFLPGVPIREVPPHMRDVWSRLAWLASPSEDTINLWKNYNLCQRSCLKAGVKLISSWTDDASDIITDDAVGSFVRLDTTSDRIHRGPISHAALGKLMLRSYLGC